MNTFFNFIAKKILAFYGRRGKYGVAGRILSTIIVFIVLSSIVYLNMFAASRRWGAWPIWE